MYKYLYSLAFLRLTGEVLVKRLWRLQSEPPRTRVSEKMGVDKYYLRVKKDDGRLVL